MTSTNAAERVCRLVREDEEGLKFEVHPDRALNCTCDALDAIEIFTFSTPVVGVHSLQPKPQQRCFLNIMLVYLVHVICIRLWSVLHRYCRILLLLHPLPMPCNVCVR